MGVDSNAHPVLISSLVDGLAEVGRLRNLGTLRSRPDRRPVAAANSAYRVRALEDSWVAPDLGGVVGPVLLVDDETDTGWTFTMAARALRRAGAESVLPFALACVN
jgi:ATP-dependent DNA helicase RecQ